MLESTLLVLRASSTRGLPSRAPGQRSLPMRDRVSTRALTSALSVVQASGEISVRAPVRVHSDISPGTPFAPSRALKGHDRSADQHGAHNAISRSTPERSAANGGTGL